jgi:3-oxoacyl-[acyl-carrier-protein] synthase-1
MPALPERIAITATGIITALGTGANTHFEALRDSRHGLRHARVLTTVHAAEYPIGEVRASMSELLARLDLGSDTRGYTRTSLLALMAVGDLLREPGLADVLRKSDLAFVNANTVGGMTEAESRYVRFIAKESDAEQEAWIDTTDCADSTNRIAKFYNLPAKLATISTACSSSANSLILGARMIRQGLANKVIAGGSDALSRFTLNGFASLKNLDHGFCQPFDQQRNGLNLGEGGAYVLLERESDARARGAEILAFLSGWSNTNDAYHPTAPAPDGSGAKRTMENALRTAGLKAGDIDYINAHGTATFNNDIAEGKAIEALWDGAPPPFSSTKPFTGHTLAAAGAVEAILSITAMRHGIIPPNLNWTTGMDELGIQPERVTRTGVQLKHVLSNSFGFGGSNVSLILSAQ